MLKILLQCLAVFIGAAAFLPLIPSTVWWIRGFDYPRMQLLTLAAVAACLLAWAGVESFWPDGGILAFVAIGGLFQAWRVWPYSRWHRVQVLSARGDDGVSLFITNVLMTNRHAGKLLERIRETRPDLVLALETDAWWVERLGSLSGDYPHSVEVPQDDTYGMVLRSRIPLEETTVERMVRANVPSIHTRFRLKNGEAVRLFAVHPKPPFPDEDATTVDRDAELLLIGRKVAETRGPAIVAGDLNDVAWSRTTHLFQKISQLLDPRVGRGRFSTYHASHRWLRWPLDHVFISDHFRLRRLELQPHVGSDHFPILADLSFEPAGRDRQDAPEEEREDREEARAKIARAKKAPGSARSFLARETVPGRVVSH